MFTGLVADLGTVEAMQATADGVRLRVSSSVAGDLAEGDSVAVNGVCLTATESPSSISPARRVRTESVTPSPVASTASTRPRSATSPVNTPTTPASARR